MHSSVKNKVNEFSGGRERYTNLVFGNCCVGASSLSFFGKTILPAAKRSKWKLGIRQRLNPRFSILGVVVHIDQSSIVWRSPPNGVP